MTRRSFLALSVLSLALVGCGGGGGGRGRVDDTKDATARLRLFNGSRQTNLGLTLNSLDANGLAPGVDFAGTATYRTVADGTYRLGIATNGGAGATLATLEGTAFEGGQTYGAFAYGASAEGLLFAQLSSIASDLGTSRNVNIVNLLEGEYPIYADVSRAGKRQLVITFSEPEVTGITDLGFGGGIPVDDRFAITIYQDGSLTTPLVAPLTFDVDGTRPATVVLYGSRTSPRIKVLYGVYTNPLAP